MNQSEHNCNRIKTYPYREQIPRIVLGLIVLLVLVVFGDRPITRIDLILIGAFVPFIFCSHRKRPYWFFAGILVGVILANAVKVHSILAR